MQYISAVLRAAQSAFWYLISEKAMHVMYIGTNMIFI